MNTKTERGTLEGFPGASHASQALMVKMDMLIYLSGQALASLEKKMPMHQITWWHVTPRSGCNVPWSMASAVRNSVLWGKRLSHTHPWKLLGPIAGPCTQGVSLDLLSSSWSVMRSLSIQFEAPQENWLERGMAWLREALMQFRFRSSEFKTWLPCFFWAIFF